MMKKVGSIILVGICLISLGFSFPKPMQETLQTELQFHFAELIQSGDFTQDQLSRIYTLSLSTREKTDALVEKGQQLHQQALEMMVKGDKEGAYALRAEAAQQVKLLQESIAKYSSELQGIITIKNMVQMMQHGWEKMGALREQWEPHVRPQASSAPDRSVAPQANVRALLQNVAPHIRQQGVQVRQETSSTIAPVRVQLPQEAQQHLRQHGHLEVYSDPEVQARREALKREIEEQNLHQKTIRSQTLIQAAPKLLQAIPALLLTDPALEVLKMFAVQ